MKNIVLLGHGVGVRFVIESLLKSDLDYRVAAVVTHPYPDHKSDLDMLEKRKDVYGEYGYNVFNVQKDYGIDLLETADVNDAPAVEFIKKYEPSYIISIGCRNIIRKNFLDTFNSAVLNIHTTPLPKYRGAANDTWMILNGEWNKTLYGCMHYIDQGIDTGDIVAKVHYTIPEYAYPIDVFKCRTNTFRELLVTGLKNLSDPAFTPEKQSVDQSTTFPRLLTPVNGRIDFQKYDGMELVRFIYAFGYPFEGAHCFFNEKKINILKAEFHTDQVFHPFSIGLVFGKNESNQYKISVRGGYLLITALEVNGEAVPQNKIFRLGQYVS